MRQGKSLAVPDSFKTTGSTYSRHGVTTQEQLVKQELKAD